MEDTVRQGRLSPRKKAQPAILGKVSKTLDAAESRFRERRFDEAKGEAARAQRMLEKAFGIPGEPGQAAVSLSPFLLAKSFRTLIEFTYDYVRVSLGSGDPTSPSGLAEEGEEIFQRIAATGFHVARDPRGYSVAVVPVVWPQLPIEVNPTGAGDICSGVTAVFSGF